MTVGYSGTPLPKKLGIKPGMIVTLIGAPGHYADTLGDLPDGVVIERIDAANDLDRGEMIQYFTTKADALEDDFPALKTALTPNGTLWVSWPKGAAKVPTDLNENIVREIGLKNGLVDVKVCAVDQIWSGLKFVYRSEDRTNAGTKNSA